MSGSCNQGELCRRFSLVVLLVFVLVWWVRATEPSFSQDKAFLSPVLGEGGGRGFYWLLLSKESLYPRWIFRLCDISRGRVSFSIMAVLHRISFCRFCSSVQVSIHGNRSVPALSLFVLGLKTLVSSPWSVCAVGGSAVGRERFSKVCVPSHPSIAFVRSSKETVIKV